ncbi:MAG: hypothetical protein ACREQA_15995 [Candidatus Binatia bacterium]
MPDSARGAWFGLNITATGGTPTLDIKLQHKDELTGIYTDIPGATFAQKAATGTDSLVVYPGVAETANRLESNVLSRIIRAVATIGGTTPSFTFSLTAQFLP